MEDSYGRTAMHARKMAAMSLALAACLVHQAAGGQPPSVVFTGRVIDDLGRPVAGAKVAAYEVHFERIAGGVFLRPGAQVTTAPDGTFALAAQPQTQGGTFYECKVVAVKRDMALGWATWTMREDVRSDIRLGARAGLAGEVVDETGRPVAGAEVRANLYRTRESATGEPEREWLPGVAPVEDLGTRTDGRGRFAFSDLPAGSQVDLLVTAPGKATTYTYQTGLDVPAFKAGQTDVRVVLFAEARIEGRIIDPDTGQGLAGARFAVVAMSSGLFYYRFVCTSDDKGRFSMGGLQTGRYLLREGGLPHTEVDVESGRTTQVMIRAKTTYYGRILFQDGAPAVVKPAPWPGAETVVLLADAKNTIGKEVGRLDEQGYLRVSLSDEQYRTLQSEESWFNVLLPHRKDPSEEGQRWKRETVFGVGFLARDKQKAGAAKVVGSSREPVSLIGSTLPTLDRFGLGDVMKQASGKIVLLGFLDIQQRPSRNCLQQLTVKAQELLAKGVIVAVVQASKMDPAEFAKWIEDSEIPFSAGAVGADESGVRAAWGVRSLPWLILTDRKHTVVTEGFAIDELDSKLANLAD